MPIYPMLNKWNANDQWPLILASDWSRAMQLVINIDENGFRMPIYPMLNQRNANQVTPKNLMQTE